MTTMTTTELVRELSYLIGADPTVTWEFVDSFIKLVVGRLDEGHEIKIRGLGTFTWVDVPGKLMPRGILDEMYVPPGRKLKFVPATKFKPRRTEMSEEGMEKYGVVKDDEKVKTAQENRKPSCPGCGSALEASGLCPKCGSEPLEPKPAKPKK